MKDIIQLENEIVKTLINDILKKEDDYFKQTLTNYAIPQIKGELTKGKLKWRGIKMIIKETNFGYEKWLEQRGVQIGSKISYNYSNNTLNIYD